MASRILMSIVVDNMIRDVTKNLSSDDRAKIESKVNSNLAKSLGSDWSNLPITGPRMMALVLILNTVLLPFGIVPSLLADQALQRAKEYELEEKFSHLLEGVRDKKVQITESEKYYEIVDYAGRAGKTVKEALFSIVDTGKVGAKTIITKGKGFLTKQKGKWKK